MADPNPCQDSDQLCTVDDCPAAPRCSSGATVWHNRTPTCPPSPGASDLTAMTTPTPDEIAHTIATHVVMASVLIGSDGKVHAEQTGPGELELHLPGHTYKVTIT